MTPGIVRSQRERARAEDRRERGERAATLASINAEQRFSSGGPAAGTDPATRARLVAAVASTVQMDAARRGEPILRVDCEP